MWCRIDSLTDPEIHLTNIPFPQQLFELAEIPFAVDYSNIAKVGNLHSANRHILCMVTHPVANLKSYFVWSTEYRDVVLASLKNAAELLPLVSGPGKVFLADILWNARNISLCH